MYACCKPPGARSGNTRTSAPLTIPRVSSSLTWSHSLECGSPESLPVSPHHALPPKSDMWSLGMTLYRPSSVVFRTAGQHVATVRGFTVPIPHPPTKTTTAKLMTWIGWNEKCCRRIPVSKVLRGQRPASLVSCAT